MLRQRGGCRQLSPARNGPQPALGVVEQRGRGLAVQIAASRCRVQQHIGRGQALLAGVAQRRPGGSPWLIQRKRTSGAHGWPAAAPASAPAGWHQLAPQVDHHALAAQLGQATLRASSATPRQSGSSVGRWGAMACSRARPASQMVANTATPVPAGARAAPQPQQAHVEQGGRQAGPGLPAAVAYPAPTRARRHIQPGTAAQSPGAASRAASVRRQACGPGVRPLRLANRSCTQWPNCQPTTRMISAQGSTRGRAATRYPWPTSVAGASVGSCSRASRPGWAGARCRLPPALSAMRRAMVRPRPLPGPLPPCAKALQRLRAFLLGQARAMVAYADVHTGALAQPQRDGYRRAAPVVARCPAGW